jgi:hypothetical protein
MPDHLSLSDLAHFEKCGAVSPKNPVCAGSSERECLAVWQGHTPISFQTFPDIARLSRHFRSVDVCAGAGWDADQKVLAVQAAVSENPVRRQRNASCE